MDRPGVTASSGPASWKRTSPQRVATVKPVNMLQMNKSQASDEEKEEEGIWESCIFKYLINLEPQITPLNNPSNKLSTFKRK